HAIDEEVRRVIEGNYDRGRQILTGALDKLQLMPAALMKYETINASQPEYVLPGKAPQPPEGGAESPSYRPRPAAAEGPPAGGPSRPGAEPVGTEEELRRVVAVIERLRAGTTAISSVDTSKPEVMRAASAAGAGLINDVRALREPGALAAAAASGCAVCLMHM